MPEAHPASSSTVAMPEVLKAMKEGRVNDAAALAAKAIDADKVTAGIVEEKPKRTTQAILLDFLHKVTARLGMPQTLETLLVELEEALTQPAAAPAPEAPDQDAKE
jgi:hypothetical protein